MAGLLMKCITTLSTNTNISINIRREMVELIKKDSVKQKINEDVVKLIATYGYPESYLEELLILAANNPGAIKEALDSLK
jgi:Asp-tRNA(Asn)/Glu-tRNA(Gln) amidotransferase B subunit